MTLGEALHTLHTVGEDMHQLVMDLQQELETKWQKGHSPQRDKVPDAPVKCVSCITLLQMWSWTDFCAVWKILITHLCRSYKLIWPSNDVVMFTKGLLKYLMQ